MPAPQSEYYSDVAHQFCAVYKNRTDAFNMKSFHFHNVYEIYYFITGERRLFYKDRIYHITPGDIVFINKYEIHSICDWEKPGHSMLLIDFQQSFLEDLPIGEYNLFKCFENDIIVISPNAEHGRRIYEKFADITNEYNDSLDGRELSIKAQLAELLIYLSRLQGTYGDKKNSLAHERLITEAVMKYIGENYDRRLTLQAVADFIGYSKNYLCAYFKAHSGFSIVEYLNGVRIKRAQEYLKNTDMSVTDIAMLCGFDSITHFGRVFKSIAGISPLKYRKQLLKK